MTPPRVSDPNKHRESATGSPRTHGHAPNTWPDPPSWGVLVEQCKWAFREESDESHLSSPNSRRVPRYSSAVWFCLLHLDLNLNDLEEDVADFCHDGPLSEGLKITERGIQKFFFVGEG